MVRLSDLRCGSKMSFGLYNKGKKFNHRVPIQYQRFQQDINPEEIVEHYSRDDLRELDPRAGARTYKVAQSSLGRKNYLLPDLKPGDLELNEVFQKEMDRQRAVVSRINKINVVIDSIPGRGTELMMNKDLSTPYECAQHINRLLTSRSIVAEISPLNVSEEVKSELSKQESQTTTDSVTDNETKTPSVSNSIYWDMHRPLDNNYRIKFRHFMEKDVSEVNKIYWRSCSFIMGMAIRLAFKDEIKVLLHSWPKPNIRTGSFVYDVAINLKETWKPSEQELMAFTKVMWRIKNAALPFERLQVNRDVARALFANNLFKLNQIDSILENKASQGQIIVYRCGGLLDMSIGPMISDTSQIGRISLAAVHPFASESKENEGVFYRFQGVSIPQQLPLSSYLYQNIIINRAKELNKTSMT